MRLPRLAIAVLVAAALPAGAQTPPAPAQASGPAQPRLPAIVPAAPGECAALPKPRSGPHPFSAGEQLGYDVDVMGVRAGRMVFEVLPTTGKGATAEIPIRVRAESNTFFTKVRRIKAEVLSYLRARDLRPLRFREEMSEGAASKLAQVEFDQAQKLMQITWKTASQSSMSRNKVVNDGLDYVGAIYLFRAMPLKVGQTFCFEAYSMRRVWRVEGKVEAKEPVSTPAGEFEAFHLSGVATRLGAGKPMVREMHVWISDDARRLPLAAVGVIDLGPVRATLSSVVRDDFDSGQSERPPVEW